MSKWKKKAKTVFQKWIRLRDADEQGYVTCCTCGVKRQWNDRMDAGHFIPATHLATCFDERNVHAQCKGCNSFKNGDIHSYDQFMDKKYGREVINELRAKRHQVTKITAQEYQELIDKYTDLSVGESIRIGIKEGR